MKLIENTHLTVSIWFVLGAIALALGGASGWYDSTGDYGGSHSTAELFAGAVINGVVFWVFYLEGRDNDKLTVLCGLVAPICGGLFAGMTLLGGYSLEVAVTGADIGFLGGIAIVLAPIGASVGFIIGLIMLAVFWVFIAPNLSPPVSGDDLPYGGWITSILTVGLDVIFFALVWGKHFWGRSRR